MYEVLAELDWLRIMYWDCNVFAVCSNNCCGLFIARVIMVVVLMVTMVMNCDATHSWLTCDLRCARIIII